MSERSVDQRGHPFHMVVTDFPPGERYLHDVLLYCLRKPKGYRVDVAQFFLRQKDEN